MADLGTPTTPAAHWTGPVQVLGFSHANAAADGRAVAEAYLTYLARHPDTARRLARKLAIRFVSDRPSAALVDHLAEVYLANETAIVPVLRALVAHPEFVAAAGLKVRTPTDDVVATYRALDVRPRRRPPTTPAPTRSCGRPRRSGRRPSTGPAPTGSRRTTRRGPRPPGCSPPSRSTTRWAAAGGPTASDLPPGRIVGARSQAGQSMRFDALVDHLSRTPPRPVGDRPAGPGLLPGHRARPPATAITPTTPW